MLVEVEVEGKVLLHREVEDLATSYGLGVAKVVRLSVEVEKEGSSLLVAIHQGEDTAWGALPPSIAGV